MTTSIGKLSKSFFIKLLVGIIILPFVFWGMGDVFRGGNQNVIATIDSDKVSTQEFVKYLNRLNLNNEQIKTLESHGSINVKGGVKILIDDVEIISKDIAGYSVSTNNYFSVALDVSISQELSDEGLAREFINRIQNLRKDKGFLVTDKIYIELEKNNEFERAIKNNLTYICNETLTEELKFSSKKLENYEELNLVNNIICKVLIYKK